MNIACSETPSSLFGVIVETSIGPARTPASKMPITINYRPQGNFRFRVDADTVSMFTIHFLGGSFVRSQCRSQNMPRRVPANRAASRASAKAILAIPGGGVTYCLDLLNTSGLPTHKFSAVLPV